jgi:hypothetical protein
MFQTTNQKMSLEDDALVGLRDSENVLLLLGFVEVQ